MNQEWKVILNFTIKIDVKDKISSLKRRVSEIQENTEKARIDTERIDNINTKTSNLLILTPLNSWEKSEWHKTG